MEQDKLFEHRRHLNLAPSGRPAGEPALESPAPQPSETSPQAPPTQETNDLPPLQESSLVPGLLRPVRRRPGAALTAAAHAEEDLSHLPAAERHRRKCQICNHPDREAIEEEYLDWFAPWRIAKAYDIPVRPLYRHFRAMGLPCRRRENLQGVVDHILQWASEAECTGDTVLRAVRVATCLTPDNKWIEPATNVIFSTRSSPQAGAIAAASIPCLAPGANPEITIEPAAIPPKSGEFLIDTGRLEIDASH
jgi:hypothetical protein